jgi:acid stress-induced BolA-like protein IbaG/YrbA
MPITVEELNTIVPPNEVGDFADFEFDRGIGKFVGHVVLRDFRGVSIAERQRWIRDQLNGRFGEESQKVSLVLGYSPQEWQEVNVESA